MGLEVAAHVETTLLMAVGSTLTLLEDSRCCPFRHDYPFRQHDHGRGEEGGQRDPLLFPSFHRGRSGIGKARSVWCGHVALEKESPILARKDKSYGPYGMDG